MALICKGIQSSAKISVSNNKALVDEKIDITVKGLQLQQMVTLVAALRDNSAEFVSHAHYQANNIGEVDLKQMSSEGGSYTGTDQMGLFWSMNPSQNTKKGTRLYKKDVTEPFRIKLSVLNGYQDVTDTPLENVICTCDVERWYMGNNVQKETVKEGRLRGTLFTPKGKGPFPGVIDLFGSAGGLIEFRAALLASRGFCTLALAFFGYDDLPPGVKFDYDYFDEAIKWMSSRQVVNNKGLGVIGVSKGAEIALHMACYNTNIKACVALGGLYFYSFGVHTYKGKDINLHIHDVDKLKSTDNGTELQDTCQERNSADVIPFEKSGHCQLLLIQGDDDTNIGIGRTNEMADILKKHGMSNYKVLNYPGAGHLIEPPYSPNNKVVYHKMLGSNIHYGGEPSLHAIAQEHSWQNILALFSEQLGRNENENLNSKM